MKKILLISNEKTAQDSGVITRHGKYGIPAGLCNIENLKAHLSSLGEYEVRILHHSQVGQLGDDQPDYVFLSGRFSAWDNDALDTEYADLLHFIRFCEVPMFGICAGLQLIGRAFGSKIAPMEDTTGEHGFTSQTVLQKHPILKGLETGFSCMELHCDEVKSVPEGFDLLTTTDRCHVQMITHKTRPIFGTQFHPEIQNDAEKDGDVLLKNFFKLY